MTSSGSCGGWARGRRLILVLGLLVLLGVSAATRGDALDDYLRREQAARQIPGLALAVVRHGRSERVATDGIANLETGTPVTPDSVFAIASRDKGLIAAGVLKAAELGKLAVDDPITKHVDVPFPSTTLAMLLSHTSGLPDMDEALADCYGSRPYQRYRTGDLLAAVRGARLLAAPGTQHHYSDAGIFLAQLATANATGKPWWDSNLAIPAVFHENCPFPGVAQIPCEASDEDPVNGGPERPECVEQMARGRGPCGLFRVAAASA